eukprot:1134099-Pelagomonas_calceolata.AAC.1
MQALRAAGFTKRDQLSAENLLFLLAFRWYTQNWQRWPGWQTAGYHTGMWHLTSSEVLTARGIPYCQNDLCPRGGLPAACLPCQHWLHFQAAYLAPALIRVLWWWRQQCSCLMEDLKKEKAKKVVSPKARPAVDGDWKFDSRRGVLVWTIELIDETNRSGSMEFVVPAADSDSFYPVEVSFGTNKTMCDINVDSVIHTMKDTPIKFSSKRQLVTSDYTVT